MELGFDGKAGLISGSIAFRASTALETKGVLGDIFSLRPCSKRCGLVELAKTIDLGHTLLPGLSNKKVISQLL